MGHTRIGRIPKSKSWEKIIELLNSSGDEAQRLSKEDIASIANDSILATEKGLIEASNDTGVYNAIFIVAKILEAIATKVESGEYYIDINKMADSREFAFEVHSRVRSFFVENCISSDKSEIALRSISKSILEATAQKQLSLDGSGSGNELKKLASKNGFAEFGQRFIANYTYSYVNFFLSRVSNYSVGRECIQNINQLSHFNAENQKHWNESSYIVRDLSGTWFAKKVFYEKDLTPQSVKSYLSLAFRKMSSEAKTQRGKQ
ncbi:MAG: hypothetical protein RBR41_02865 [Desulfovibrio sp.]|uniref:hypothetical protein n=1 Tax=Desulfovibrio sp. TaxID=885 RepID=UPI002A3649AA|nr:hypothetical protein [Desulfovibrio sp.]MDY0258591.1 hypothetical protein [Desulfovibrio sp.]